MASVRRAFNELEQTLSNYGINLGTKNLQIIDSKDFKDAYNAAFKVFGAEAHHIIDLAWVDRTLGAAGRSPESRAKIIENLNKLGVDTGNQPLNIAPQSQQRPKFGRTGMAHKWVHDLYKQIPSAEQVFSIDDISELSDEDLTEYMLESSRMRKQIVVDAMNHKLTALRQQIPQSKSWSAEKIRQYASSNKEIWGSLGDDTFQQTVKLPDPTKIKTVPGQPRGRIPVPATVEKTFLGRQLGFLGLEPTGLALGSAGAGVNLVRKNIAGAVAGAGSLIEPEAVKSALQGDYKEAAKQTVGGAVVGATTQQIAKTAISSKIGQAALSMLPKGGSIVLGRAAAIVPPVAAAVGAVQMLDAVVEGATGKNLQETGVAAEETKQRLKEEGYSDYELRRRARTGYKKPEDDEKPSETP
jgi:hypothetical protein